MMKKILSLLLCAAVLLVFAAASAGDMTAVNFRDRFQIQGTLPDGYKCSILSQTDMTLEAEIASDDPAAPVMTLYVSFSEIYADVKRLNDLSAVDLERIKQGFSAEYDVTFDEAETSLGTKLLVVREVGSDQDFLDFYTIYRGHDIELLMSAGEGAPDRTLTDRQAAMCIDFLSKMDIVPVE